MLFQTRDRVRNHGVGGALAPTLQTSDSSLTMSLLERVAGVGESGAGEEGLHPLKSVLSLTFPNKAV